MAGIDKRGGNAKRNIHRRRPSELGNTVEQRIERLRKSRFTVQKLRIVTIVLSDGLETGFQQLVGGSENIEFDALPERWKKLSTGAK
jgi:hypothetical protein